MKTSIFNFACELEKYRETTLEQYKQLTKDKKYREAALVLRTLHRLMQDSIDTIAEGIKQTRKSLK